MKRLILLLCFFLLAIAQPAIARKDNAFGRSIFDKHTIASRLATLGAGHSSKPGGGECDFSTLPGLTVWLDADDVTGNTWNDQSGNGNDFTGVSGKQVTDVVNGNAVIRTGAHNVSFTSSYDLDATKETNVYYVGKFNDTQWGEVFGTASSYHLYLAQYYNADSTDQEKVYSWTAFANGFIHTGGIDYTAAFHAYRWKVNATTAANGTVEAFQDQTAYSTSSSRSRSDDSSTCIGDCRGIGQGFNGDLAELLVIEGSVSTANDDWIQECFESEYGI